MTRVQRATFAVLLAVALFACGIHPLLAQTTGSSSAIFTSVQGKTSDIFTNARNILMIVGAIGVLGLATMAFFGRFKWSWAVSLLGGLDSRRFRQPTYSIFPADCEHSWRKLTRKAFADGIVSHENNGSSSCGGATTNILGTSIAGSR